MGKHIRHTADTDSLLSTGIAHSTIGHYIKFYSRLQKRKAVLLAVSELFSCQTNFGFTQFFDDSL